MKIVKWAAVVITALMALMNLGVVLSPNGAGTALVILGAVLGLAGVAAVIGLGMNTGWGRMAVVGIGLVNAAVAAIGMTQGTEGAVIGLVVAALGAVLGWFAPKATSKAVTA